MSSIIAILSAKVCAHAPRGQPLVILALCVCLLWPALAWSTRQQEESETEGANEGEVLLDRWQPEAARQWAEKRLVSEPQHPGWRFLLGEALFELGRYADALETLDSLLKIASHPRLQAYREFVAQTIQSTATLQPIETAHFRVLLDPEKDAALAPYITDVLEQSYQRLGDIFRFTPT